MQILTANPAGNITVFVLDPVESRAERADIARAIMKEKRFGAEQVGFVTPPFHNFHKKNLWHLEMAGGEFCGNAARSFGLYVARHHLRSEGEPGVKETLFVSVSGAEEPVKVVVDAEKGRAAAEMPKPTSIDTLPFKNNSLPVIVFEGITHIIALDMEPAEENFYTILGVYKSGAEIPAAIGVMFYDTAAGFMKPAVYVRSIDSFVFESSCGSGTAALGAWLSRSLSEGCARYAISQPGGVIEAEIQKKTGEITGITIGGEVKLGESEAFYS